MQIPRRDFMKAIGAGACVAAASDAAAIGKVPPSRPNVILCMADDQGWGDVGYYGHPVLKTPSLDAMASSCLRFDQFHAAAPVCSPTRGSVMTGRHPNRFGCFSWGHTLRPQEITLADALKSAGYVTGHFGKWHLGPVYKNSPVNPGACGFDEWFSAPNFFDNDPILSREGIAVQTEGESSMVTVDAALEFIGRHSKSPDPFLAVVWFGSPHAPHEAAEEDRLLYADQPEHLQHFYGEITGIDRAVGKLREQLRALNIHENTILWYCSDNGGLPKVGSTGGRGNKGQIYEGGFRVPAILEWPAHIREPRITDVPTNTSDIYPTILDLVGVRMEGQPPLDGISLKPLIDGKMKNRPEPMGFWEHPTQGIRTPTKEFMSELLKVQQEGKEITDPALLCLNAGDVSRKYPEDSFPGDSAWLDWPWKLIRKQNKKNAANIVFELYNLSDDRMESKDLASEFSGRVKAMESALEEWLKSVVQSLNGEDYRP